MHGARMRKRNLREKILKKYFDLEKLAEMMMEVKVWSQELKAKKI